MSVNIHPTAIVSGSAEIAEDVIIGPYCVVGEKTKIGKGTVLMPFASVCEYTEVGSGCTFHQHCVIGGAPQDLGYKGEETWAKIGNNVICREYVTINRATGEGESTTIGDNCLIMEGVHVAHNVKIGKECTVANKVGFSGYVQIGDYAVIGGMVGFHQFVHVGSYCMVGGFSRVTLDVPPYCLAVGTPLRVYDINKVGLRRRGISPENRTIIRDIYRIIYNSGRTVKEGLSYVAEVYPDNDAAKMILDFAAGATRGFAPRITQDWSSKKEDKAVD